MTPWDAYITWSPSDPRWDEVEHIGASASPRVPALHVNSWHDVAVCETTRLFKHLQDRGTPEQYLIIGAGGHCIMCADRPYGLRLSDLKKVLARVEPDNLENAPDLIDLAALRFDDLEVGDARYHGVDRGWAKLFLRWFDYWLRADKNRVTEMAKVQLYVTGQGWISGDTWPLEGTLFTKYYLDDDGRLSQGGRRGILTKTPPRYEAKGSFLYDPTTPVPSLGAGFGCSLTARDQRDLEARHDVLVYRTPPIERPVTIAGPIEVVLYVSSSAKDTDFMIKLLDVYPDGKAVNLGDDAFRVRYRDGFHETREMERGEVYKITLSNMVTAMRFAEGHRIQLNVTSSNFPLYERNLNTGGNNYNEAAPVIAENKIHHGPRHRSHVILPVIRRDH